MLTVLTDAECRRRLAATHLGRLAVTLPSGRPLIRPVNFVFDQPTQSVVFRSRAGSKHYALTHASQACFEIDDGTGGVTGAWSVIITGYTEIVSQANEIERLERLGLDTWGSREDMCWIRIHANAVSGRRLATLSTCAGVSVEDQASSAARPG